MVSILVPIYNVEKYIEKCATSLFKQTCKDIEYIFVDDCSPDNSITILKETILKYPKIQNNIKIIRHERNLGLAAARNTAVRQAKGEYIIHIDSDDYIAENSIELLLKKAKTESSDIVISDFFFVYSNKKTKIINNWYGNKNEYLHSILTRKSLVNIIGMLIKRDLVINNDIWEIEGLNQGEDYLMTPKLVYYANKVSKVSLPIYYYNRTNIGSYTANITEKSVSDLISVQNNLIQFFKDKPFEAKCDIKRIIEESSIYNKISLLYCAPISAFPKIGKLYDNINWRTFNLKWKHVFLLWLIDNKYFKLTHQILSIAKKIGF